MEDMIVLKEQFDNYQIDVDSLTNIQIISLCEMYEEQIAQVERQISDINNRIEVKKHKIRSKLDEIKKFNSNANYYRSSVNKEE